MKKDDREENPDSFRLKSFELKRFPNREVKFAPVGRGRFLVLAPMEEILGWQYATALIVLCYHCRLQIQFNGLMLCAIDQVLLFLGTSWNEL